MKNDYITIFNIISYYNKSIINNNLLTNINYKTDLLYINK